MADILIRGMEMPQNCDSCFVGDCPLDQSIDGYKMQGGRPRGCPLIPLQEGHGRLIDADRLKLVLEKNFGRLGGADVLRQMIDMAPTIVPAEGGGEDG